MFAPLALALGLSLATPAALEVGGAQQGTYENLTATQKRQLVQPLVADAVACVANAVGQDPKYSPTISSQQMGELIVADMHQCVLESRALVDRYDRLFGDGAGERYFMGQYLDELPSNVWKMLHYSKSSP